jgi:hypothetical protein
MFENRILDLSPIGEMRNMYKILAGKLEEYR